MQMAYIKAFKALRYNTQKAGEISTLCCPPYDIISEKQREEFLNLNPNNIIRLELPVGENRYEDAGKILQNWLDEEILVHDMDDAIYVYEEEFQTEVDCGEIKKIKGIICRVKVEDFSAGVVLPHEETLSKAKTDRFNLVSATKCNFSQIYSLYIDEQHTTLGRINNFSQSTKPRYCFSDGLVTHRLWVINDKNLISAICEDFSSRKLYIADGHHRYETSINYRNHCKENGIFCPESEYVMMMLADMGDENLVVFPTHRLVKNLENFNSKELLEKCEEFFTVEKKENVKNCLKDLKVLYEKGEKAFCFYEGENSYSLLTLKDINVMKEILPNNSKAYQNLDVNVLHNIILERVLGIDKENMANQTNLSYTRSFEEAIESVDKKESNCAFIINPTRVAEIGEVALAGEKMPQKSTYFYPKLITGLVVNHMEDNWCDVKTSKRKSWGF